MPEWLLGLHQNIHAYTARQRYRNVYYVEGKKNRMRWMSAMLKIMVLRINYYTKIIYQVCHIYRIHTYI